MATEIILPLNGFKGRVTVENGDGIDTTIVGLSGFTIGADERMIVDVPTTFDTTRNTNIPQQKGPISFSLEGYYLLGIDSGQNYLKSAYDDETEITSIKFWLNETEYIQPVTGDYVRITGLNEIATTAESFASFGATGFFYYEYEAQTQS